MGTTAIVAEILVIGLEALVWIGVGVAALFGPGALSFGEVADNDALIVLLVVAAAYVLGVMLDRAADSTLLWFDSRFDCRFDRYRSRRIAHVNTMRVQLMAPDLGVAPFLEYQRSRVRVARGTVFNLFFLIFAANLYLFLQQPFDPAAQVIAFLGGNLIGIALLVGAYDVFRRISNAWLKILNGAYQLLIVEPGTKGKARKNAGDAAGAGELGGGNDELGRETDEIVAGVVHRRGSRGVEFLLVRTKDGCFWTFPKGHREDGEDARTAVLREIREEAGVRGSVEREPLTTYRYPPSREDQTDDSIVTAFLVTFSDRGAAQEKRGSGWFAPDKAKTKLADGRAGVYADAAAAVVDAAVAALADS